MGDRLNIVRVSRLLCLEQRSGNVLATVTSR